jgi:tetratricopeptide (TPR) repeat protein
LALTPAAARAGDGYELLDAGDLAGARAWFEARLEEVPDDAGAWEGLAWACMAAADIECAVRAADRRSEIRPDDAWTPKHQLIAWMDLSRRDQALEMYSAWVEAHPGDSAACAELGALL